jgi:hypothetical protein
MIGEGLACVPLKLRKRCVCNYLRDYIDEDVGKIWSLCEWNCQKAFEF